MKYLLEIVLTTIIIFFVWNALKRIFFKKFYHFPNNQNKENLNQNQPKDKISSKINWDAESVDFEEIKKEKK